MVVEWLGKDFALDILAVFPLYGHFACLFCRIIHRQIKKSITALCGNNVVTLFACFIMATYLNLQI